MLSTLLAVIIIGFSKSYVFRVFFKALFLTVLIGGAHGLLFLPHVQMRGILPRAYSFARGAASAYDSTCMDRTVLALFGGDDHSATHGGDERPTVTKSTAAVEDDSPNNSTIEPSAIEMT